MGVSLTMNRVRANVDAGGFSTATIARLFGVSQPTISNSFRGLSYMGAEREAQLLTLSVRLLELQAALLPLREPTDPDDLRRLLDATEESEITPGDLRVGVSNLFSRTNSSAK